MVLTSSSQFSEPKKNRKVNQIIYWSTFCGVKRPRIKVVDVLSIVEGELIRS